MAQVRDGKVQGLAAQLLCQDLDKLAAERQQLADLIGPEPLARLWRTNPARLLDPLPESIHHPPVDNTL